MSTFSNAPLIEVIFELRWGKFIKDESNAKLGIQFTQEENQLFFGQFKSIAESKGFRHIERINSKIVNPLPHVVTYRFRKLPNTWPCYQIGLGIFTVNQVVEEYDWNSFKNSCLSGIELLDDGHPLGLEGLSQQKIGTQLQYQDAFTFSEDEGSTEFLKTKLNIGFETPQGFIENDNFLSEVNGIQFSFDIHVKEPKGILNITAQEGLINNDPGIILNTILRSSDSDTPELTEHGIGEWLHKGHAVQKYAFESLINPT